MWQQRDLITLAAAILLHAGLVYSMTRLPPPGRQAPRVVELDVRSAPPQTPPPPPAPEPPPLAPEPPRKAGVKRRAMHASRPSAPPPAAASPPPKVAPARPLFGVTMDSLTEGPSSVSVPLGESTLADPGAPREGSGLPAPPPAPPPPAERPYKPVSSLAVKTLPEIDSEACGRGITYPKEARALGIEGDVVLRVELDDQGKVRRVRVVSGLGHGLDQAAVAALTRTCRFTPAYDSAGQPVAYIIPAYTFHFELPR